MIRASIASPNITQALDITPKCFNTECKNTMTTPCIHIIPSENRPISKILDLHHANARPRRSISRHCDSRITNRDNANADKRNSNGLP